MPGGGIFRIRCGIDRLMIDMKRLQSAGFKRAFILMPLLLAACGGGGDTQAREDVPKEARSFSADDKRAAASLSIGNVQSVSSDMTAYDRSLTCSIALQQVKTRLSASGQLNTAIIDSINQVNMVYDNQVRQLGAADNKSSADIAADRTGRTEEMMEQSQQGQIAIGCLRALI